MRNLIKRCIAAIAVVLMACAHVQAQENVVDIATRPGVTQRMLVISPATPRAGVVLFAGGHGGLQIRPNGSMKWGDSNFLVRTRQLFADQGFMVVVMDAPSDRQNPPYLGGFRQKAEHASDIKAVITWMRSQSKAPVWLVGTSRGTQSVAYAATELSDADGPDGIVLSSTILTDDSSRPVPAMPLGKIRIPVLVVHHEQDACNLCTFSNLSTLMNKLTDSSRKELLTFKGGNNKGDPCEAMAYHGFNGLERDVVQKTAAWILSK